MDDSMLKLRQRLFEAINRLRRERVHPPVPSCVTQTEGFVLMVVAHMEQCGRRVRSGELAKFSHSTPSAVSQVLKSLEEKGFVSRQRDEGDCRGVTVHLTEAGWGIDKRNRRLHDQRLDDLLAYLGEDDAREFVRIMERLATFNQDHPWVDKEQADGAVSSDSVAAGVSPEANSQGEAGDGTVSANNQAAAGNQTEAEPAACEQGDVPCA